MSNLYCKEETFWLHDGKASIIEAGQPYETKFDKVGDLYRACLREFGRCTGKVYVENNGKDIPVGWTFLRRNPEDTPPTKTLLEKAVIVYVKPPVRRMVEEGTEYAKIGR